MNQTTNESTADSLKRATPARIDVGRSGTRPTTRALLDFRGHHAQARDAVKSELSPGFIDAVTCKHEAFVVQSLAGSRNDFIANPPRGKQVDEKTLDIVRQICVQNPDVQVVLSDGLAASAVESYGADVLELLLEGLAADGLAVGTLIIAKYGRVAVGDPLAHAVGARMVVNLLGERPGLSSVAMSAYLTFNPGPHTISSDRTVLSNISANGTPPVEAGAHLVKLCRTILDTGLSGVKLQKTL